MKNVITSREPKLMKTINVSLWMVCCGLASPLWAANSSDEVKAAIQKLADQPNYSWTAKVESPQRQREGGGGQGGNREGREGRRGGGGGGFGRGGFAPPSGKTEKDGFTVLSFAGRSNNTTEVVVKGEKVALKDGDEWKTAEELADNEGGEENRFNIGRMTARRAQTTKLPAAEATEMLGRVSELKKEGDAYSGNLTADGIKQMYTFPGRNRGQGGQGGQGGTGEGGQRREGGERRQVDTSGLKGTGKFWVKDGVLAKYETHVLGKMPGFPGRDGTPGREIEVDRTTTVEIKDVGATKIAVAPEARKKLK
jgi:hypothetical protein